MNRFNVVTLVAALGLAGCNVTEAPIESLNPATGPDGEPALSPRVLDVSGYSVTWIQPEGGSTGGGNTPTITGEFLTPSEGGVFDSANNLRAQISLALTAGNPGVGSGSAGSIDQLYLIAADNTADAPPDDIVNEGLFWPLCPDEGCEFTEYTGWVSGVRLPNVNALSSLPFLGFSQMDVVWPEPNQLYLAAKVGDDHYILDNRDLAYSPQTIDLTQNEVEVTGEQSLKISWSPGEENLEYVVRSFSVDDFVDQYDLFSLYWNYDAFIEWGSGVESDFVGFIDGLFRRQERIPDTQSTYSDTISGSESRLYQVVGVNGHGIVAESEYILTPPYLKVTDLSEYQGDPFVTGLPLEHYGGFMLQYTGAETCQITVTSPSESGISMPCHDFFYYPEVSSEDNPDFYMSGIAMAVVTPCLNSYSQDTSTDSTGPGSVSVEVVLEDDYGGVRRETLTQECLDFYIDTAG